MADRLSLVVYKSPTQRIIEIALVLAAGFGAAAFWQILLPKISSSYITVATLFLAYALITRLGTLWAARRGNDLVTENERSRRYLSEIGPMSAATPALNPMRRRARSR